jgi:hypothetical protein
MELANQGLFFDDEEVTWRGNRALLFASLMNSVNFVFAVTSCGLLLVLLASSKGLAGSEAQGRQ